MSDSDANDFEDGRIDFSEDQQRRRRVDEGDCCWTLKMAGKNQKIVWVLLYTLLLTNVINLFLAGASRFNHSQGAGLALFLFQLLLIVPLHFFFVYVVVIKKWMIVP